ncbi:unnamed protein product, partial [Allacma fusca]
MYFGTCSSPNTDWLLNTQFALTGAASHWFKLTGQDKTTFDAFKKNIIAAFSGEQSNDERLLQITNRKQKAGEDFATFAMEIYYMFEAITPARTETQRCSYIIENCHPSIRTYFRVLDMAKLKLQGLLDKERQIRRDLAASDEYFSKEHKLNTVEKQPVSEKKDAEFTEEVQINQVDKERLCHKCKQPGHIARNCTTKPSYNAS